MGPLKTDTSTWWEVAISYTPPPPPQKIQKQKAKQQNNNTGLQYVWSWGIFMSAI